MWLEALRLRLSLSYRPLVTAESCSGGGDNDDGGGDDVDGNGGEEHY